MPRLRKSFAASRAASDCRTRKRPRDSGCSRSSVSSHDTARSCTGDRLDLEPVVEHHDVGGPARPEHADVVATEEARRHLGRGTYRLLEGYAESMEVAHGVDHRE